MEDKLTNNELKILMDNLTNRFDKFEDKFDKFIEKWCGNMFPHLVDSDGNDGEEFRLYIDALIDKATAQEKKRCAKIAREHQDEYAMCVCGLIAKAIEDN